MAQEQPSLGSLGGTAHSLLSEDFTLIDDLCESRLFPSRLGLKKFTAKEVADLTFLTCVALHILKSEFDYLDFSARYARATIQRGNFSRFVFGANDLYVLAYFLVNETGFKKHPSNDIFLKNVSFDVDALKRWLRSIMENRSEVHHDRRFLLKLEHDLQISDSSYKSMRRLCVHWGEDATQREKSLTITRLLLALRTRARRHDLLPSLEKLAKNRHLELKTACNPETGECPTKKGSLLSKVAGLAAGAAMGHYLVKSLNKKTPPS